MKHPSLIGLLFLLFYSINSQAQDFLVFPEANYQPIANLSINACMAQCNQLLINLDQKDSSAIADLRRRGQQLTYQGKHEVAAEVFKKILELNKNKYGKNHINYAKSVIDLARVYVLLIRYNNSIGMYKEALATFEKITGKNSIEYLTVSNELSLLYTRVYDYTNTQKLLLEQLQIIPKINKENSLHHAIVLNNLAACFMGLQKPDLAIENYKKALVLVEKKPRYTISIGANLAEAYTSSSNEKDRAQINPLLEKYSSLAKKKLIEKNLTYARTWTQFAVAYMKAGNFKKSEEALQTAFVTNSLTFTKVDDIPNQANDLMFNNEFLATCAQAGIMMYSIELYKQKYRLSGDINDLKEGYKIVTAMTKYGEKLMNSYLSEENKLKLFRLGGAVLFDRAIFYANELHQATGETHYLHDAFFWIERSKSTLLVNALSSKQGQEYMSLPTAITQQQKTLKSQYKTLEKQLIEASGLTKDTVRQEMNELMLTIENFKNDLKAKYPSYYQHRYDTKITELAVLQDQLNNDQIMVEYFLGMSNDYALVISKRAVQFVPLVFDKIELETNTKLLRKSLSDYEYITKNGNAAKESFKNTAHYFYKVFIEELLDPSMKGKHLIIIPDAGLGHLPFEIFLSEKPQQKDSYAELPYLIKNYTMSYSYSATIFMAQNNQGKPQKTEKKGVLAFAAQYGDTEETGTAVRSRRGGDIANIRQSLSPLPGAEKEVEMMKKHLYGEFFRGQPANEQKFKETAKDYSIIHLAMHGVLDDRSPILSSLVFSADTSSQEDNFLRAYEIAQLDLNADLVVLSACETGYGKFQQGEGIMSLAHSFTYAGASSVLMSLWQVNDYSTGVIMKNFYSNIAKGMTKDKALQKAKLDYLDEAKTELTQHPAFWAAFVQQGDVKPLDLVAKSGLTFKQMGGIGMGLLLAIAAGLIRWKQVRKKVAP